MTTRTPMRIVADTEKSIAKRVAFTTPIVQAARCADGKDRIWLYDSRQPGLALMVTAAGSKSFYTYSKVKGRPQRVRLGGFPEIGVEQARKLAKRTLGQISEGRDPMADRREGKIKGMNLGELWEWHYQNWVEPHRRSARSDKNRYENHLKTWATRRLADITLVDVAALHHRVAKATSPPTANRVLALLSTMFSNARQIGWNDPNPCKGVRRFAEQSRERYLSAAEVKTFFEAMEAEPNPLWRDIFTVALFSGVRKGNVLSMRWAELDLDAGQWAIPATKFKNRTAVIVHLPTPAVDVLNARKGNGSEWVFPSRSKQGHAAKPDHAWRSLCTRANFKNLRLHDLRRTLGSWQAAGGSSLVVIGKSLGHKSQQTTRIYARLDLDPVRQSVDKAAAALVAAKTKEQAVK